MHPEELAAIRSRVEAATPGPWFVSILDDEAAMTLVAVSTKPMAGSFSDGSVGHDDIVAATLVQQPRYVDHHDGRHDHDAAFIAAARTDIPRLLAEIEVLAKSLPVELSRRSQSGPSRVDRLG